MTNDQEKYLNHKFKSENEKTYSITAFINEDGNVFSSLKLVNITSFPALTLIITKIDYCLIH